MKGYKGFDKDMKCRGMQFEVGKTYEVPVAVLCQSGLHFCERAVDCFGYYAPGDGSRYCEIEADGTITDPRTGADEDSKRAATKITILREMTLTEVIVSSACAATGNHAEGDRSAASSNGDRSAASSNGDRSAASSNGDGSAASSNGGRSAASSNGYRSAASSNGYRSAASSNGYGSAASSNGHGSAASSNGYRSAASSNGHDSAASSNGDESIACALGVRSKAKGALGNWIVVAQRSDGDDYGHIETVLTAKVDGETIKADTWYTARGGELEACDE